MTKRTLEGTRQKSIRKSGFRARMKSRTGRNVINSRRKKNRKRVVSKHS